MGFQLKQITIPQVIMGIVSFFCAILGIRLFSPMIDTILNLMGTGTTLRNVATIIVWLTYFFVVFYLPYIFLFGKKKEEAM